MNISEKALLLIDGWANEYCSATWEKRKLKILNRILNEGMFHRIWDAFLNQHKLSSGIKVNARPFFVLNDLNRCWERFARLVEEKTGLEEIKPDLFEKFVEYRFPELYRDWTDVCRENDHFRTTDYRIRHRWTKRYHNAAKHEQCVKCHGIKPVHIRDEFEKPICTNCCKVKKIGICVICGKTKRIQAKKCCHACYQRIRRASVYPSSIPEVPNRVSP